jgi:hypothetical protein
LVIAISGIAMSVIVSESCCCVIAESLNIVDWRSRFDWSWEISRLGDSVPHAMPKLS